MSTSSDVQPQLSDPHNTQGFLSWLEAYGDPDRVEYQRSLLQAHGHFYFTPDGKQLSPSGAPGYLHAKWVDDHWEPMLDEPPVPGKSLEGLEEEGDGVIKHIKRTTWTVQGPSGVNAFEALARAQNWTFRYNEMSQTVSAGVNELDKEAIAKIRFWLETRVWLETALSDDTKRYERFVATETEVVRWATEVALDTGRFHPVKYYLDSLPVWDGSPRIDALLGWVLGSTVEGDYSGELTRLASSNIVMGLVNRAMDPGCTWPLMTILWGGQGIGKSAFLQLLMPPDSGWHYESPVFPLSDEQLFDYTRNKWLIEFSDPSTRRIEAESAKTFLSRNSYSYRHKYDRLSTRHTYNFNMVATGNADGNTIVNGAEIMGHWGGVIVYH